MAQIATTNQFTWSLYNLQDTGDEREAREMPEISHYTRGPDGEPKSFKFYHFHIVKGHSYHKTQHRTP